jgi:hypothetical protein
MKPVPDAVVRYGASIVIAKYPDGPNQTQRQAATDFMALLAKLFGLARNKPDTRSRTTLTAWAQSNFRVWTQADYAAGSPSRWGPHLWRLMFRCANRYTTERRGLFWAWMRSLRYMLPCEKCAEHYRRMLDRSHKKWRRVKKSSQLTRYFKWMQRTVRRRVRNERKKIYFGSKHKKEWPGTTTTRKGGTRTRDTRHTRPTKATTINNTQGTRGRNVFQHKP